jgi:ribosome biogenesis protein Nip4
MRPLTDDETKVFFEKLAEYVGRNIKQLLDRADEPYCFRLHEDRVYYLSERLMRQAASIGRENLFAAGTCFGKFTHSRKFHLKVTALDVLSEHAKFKIWVKPSSEMSYLYGNHILKAGVGRMTEGVPQYSGVIVLSMSGIPLGFGRANHSTEQVRDLDPTAIAVLHQSDIGEYLRLEQSD